MKREELNNIVKHLALLGQLGLSVLMPTLLCLLFCFFLTSRLGVGMWVYILGFFFGFGGSIMTAYKFYLSEIAKNKKDDKEKKVSFNKHL